jgi:hypothetical protein
MGRPKANLELTEVQRQELERMVRAGRSENEWSSERASSLNALPGRITYKSLSA